LKKNQNKSLIEEG